MNKALADSRSGEVSDVAKPSKPDGRNGRSLANLERFLVALPPVNPEYAALSDDEILALMVSEHA